MPLVRIDVEKGRTSEELRKLADTIQDVMLNVFAASRVIFQIITEHDKFTSSPKTLALDYSARPE
jgi:phenylpyruvate tautomerase PptA (4-oxalocrotonate tautomerase family)